MIFHRKGNRDMEKIRINVNGISLTSKEKEVYDLVAELGTVSANDLAGKTNYSIHSVRATLARLNATHGLTSKGAKLVDNKAITTYTVKGE
jgi:DNA-binding CsgD family transcriptional regulator